MTVHRFNWEQKDDGPCDAHGCTGHTIYTVFCSCGWKQEFRTYFGRPDEKELMTNHRLDYLEKIVAELEAKYIT